MSPCASDNRPAAGLPTSGSSVAEPVHTTAGSHRLLIDDGTLQWLKWLGLVLMTLDHVNKYLFNGALPGVYPAGRIVMPLFGFILAYNLARPNAWATGAYLRTSRRLLAAGLAASPAYIAMARSGWPLNVLFTLGLFVAALHCVQQPTLPHRIAGVGLFLLGGALVEFEWFAVLSCITAWAFCRQPTLGRLAAWSLALTTLATVNGNLWALAVVPLVLASTGVRLPARRFRAVFYIYYPAHLYALWAVQHVIR
jgi:hypothetical protein